MPPLQYAIPGFLRAREGKPQADEKPVEVPATPPMEAAQDAELQPLEPPTELAEELPQDAAAVPATPMMEAMQEVYAELQPAEPPTELAEEELPQDAAAVPATPMMEAMQEVYAELPRLSPPPPPEPPAEDEKPADDLAPVDKPPEETPSVEEPVKTKLGLGSVVADPANETRAEFLERARKKLKTPLAKVIEKAKAVEGLWELWADEPDAEPATKKRRTETKTAPKTKATPKSKPEPVPTAPKAKAVPAEAAPRRGRPGFNADLRERILAGGAIEDVEQYNKVQVLIKNEMRQQFRMLKALKAAEAQAANDAQLALRAAADKWADDNGMERLRRVESQQQNNDMQIRVGLQMVTEGSRKNSELLTQEVHLSRRAQG